MSRFFIGDHVDVKDTRQTGVIKDIYYSMSSEALHVYEVSLDYPHIGTITACGCSLSLIEGSNKSSYHYDSLDAQRYSVQNKKERATVKKEPAVIDDISKVYFNDPVTVVTWKDGTKTIVRCSENDIYDEQVGLAMAILKRACGNDNSYHKIFKKFCPKKG